MTGSKAHLISYLIAAVVVLGCEPGHSEQPSPTPPPAINLDYANLSAGRGSIDVAGTPGNPVTLTYAGVLEITSGEIAGNPAHGQYTLSDQVRLHAQDLELRADRLVIDVPGTEGVAYKALLRLEPYTIRSERIAGIYGAAAPPGKAGRPSRVARDFRIVAQNASISTVPPGVRPAFTIHVREATFILRRDPVLGDRRAAVLRNASIYVFHTRILTLRTWKFQSSDGTGQPSAHSITPQLGYSGRYGYFVSATVPQGTFLPASVSVLLPTGQAPQLRTSATQVFFTGKPIPSVPDPVPAPNDYPDLIRRFTTAYQGRLPAGDPLLFHSFLSDPEPIRLFDAPPRASIALFEEVSAHEAASGRLRNDLYVSRLPEARIYGTLPLNRPEPYPGRRSGADFRHYLKHPTLYATASADYGRFEEQPTNVDHTRNQYVGSLWITPALVAPNTVIEPRLLYTFNHYGSGQDYRYTTASIAATHYFTNRTALTVNYASNSVSGNSPFDFDALDTSHELDGRLQIGNRRIAVAGEINYDLDRHGVIGYKLTVAPSVGGLVPLLTYDRRSRSIGVGAALEGITF